MTEQRGDDAIIGTAFRYSLIVFALLGIGVAAISWWSGRESAPEATVIERAAEVAVPETAPVQPPDLKFVDVTDVVGVDFVHTNGARGERLLPETMGGGVAFFDYDNDGDADLLFVNSSDWPWEETEGKPATMALYRNDDGRFTDVTEEAGLSLSFYGMGVGVGDVDGDGWRDLYLTAVGPNVLLMNHNGRFEAADLGVTGPDDAWSTDTAFFDYDNDGDLDLFVTNYVQWSRDLDIEVDYRLAGVGRAYGPPMNFPGSNDVLYRNDNGSFTDVSAASGIRIETPHGEAIGKGLAVVPADLDGDGDLDLVVANDTTRNFLFDNQGDGTFVERGTDSGIAFDNAGKATGAMGTDVAHAFGNDDVVIAIGNFANEMTSFFAALEGQPPFTDDAAIVGIGPASRQALTFGLAFFDADLDGRLDLLQVNGHIEEDINTVQPSQHYAQPPQLFWNCGPDCRQPYVDVTDRTGDLNEARVGRGVAYADIDGDGDLDLALTEVGGPARVLRNDQSTGNNWLRLKLVQPAPNPDAIGATVVLEYGGKTERRMVMPSRGYLSSMELPLTFGLGDTTRADTVHVLWPDGTEQTLTDVAANRTVIIERKP